MRAERDLVVGADERVRAASRQQLGARPAAPASSSKAQHGDLEAATPCCARPSRSPAYRPATSGESAGSPRNASRRCAVRDAGARPGPRRRGSLRVRMRVDAVDRRAGQQHERAARWRRCCATTSSPTGAAHDGQAVDPAGEVEHGRGGVGAAVRGQDQDAAAQPRRRPPRSRAAPRRSTGRTGRGRRCRWRRAGLGQRLPEPAGPEVELLDRGAAPGRGSRRRPARSRAGPGRPWRSTRRPARRPRRSSRHPRRRRPPDRCSPPRRRRMVEARFH